MKKKATLFLFILVLALGGITACGEKATPVVKESQIGIQLEDKAKDALEKSGQQSDEAEQFMNNASGD